MTLYYDLKNKAHPDKAKIYARFFKTGKGEYGEGDKFLGLTMPEQRVIAKKHIGMSLNELEPYLRSPYHEFRMTALLILTYKYVKASEKERKIIFNFYIKNRKAANNWDLIDVTVPRIIGAYLHEKSVEEKEILYKLVQSSDVWERMMAVLSTFYFLSQGNFTYSLRMAEILLYDKHDLIHKAVGWMLREIGKRDQEAEEKFLRKYHKTMPRTMLRYAIERFSAEKKRYYMGK